MHQNCIVKPNSLVNPKIWIVVLLSLPFAMSGSTWQPAYAQAPSDYEGLCDSLPEPVAIALPTDSSLSADTYRPDGRQQSHRPCEDTHALIGEDDRLPILNSLFPWITVGQLNWYFPEYENLLLQNCTATLVGPDLLLTNAHCLQQPLIDPNTGEFIPDSDTGNPSSQFTDESAYETLPGRLLFQPNVVKGSSPALISPPNQDYALVVSFEYGTNAPQSDAANDWALLKLDRPIGDTYGYLGWQSPDFGDEQTRTAFDRQIVLPGYSGDYPTENLRQLGETRDTAAVHVGCSLLVDDQGDGTFVHQCDTTGGASGSSLMALFDDGNYYIVGLHAGYYTLNQQVSFPDGEITDVINYGIPVPSWAEAAAAMRGENVD